MSLIRRVRKPLPKPTREMLRKVMQNYALTRPRIAKLMRVSVGCVDRYLCPDTSKNRVNIPRSRWELLTLKIHSIYNHDEEITL